MDTYYYSKGISLDMVLYSVLFLFFLENDTSWWSYLSFFFSKQVDLAVEVLVEVLSLIQVPFLYCLIPCKILLHFTLL